MKIIIIIIFSYEEFHFLLVLLRRGKESHFFLPAFFNYSVFGIYDIFSIE